MCWSPDGKYVLTGGQDDLVSIWSMTESMIVARCQGHQSWVTAVAFDPWRCDDRNYRFGSVGEDRRLLLWDFNVGMLHRPKAVSSLYESAWNKIFNAIRLRCDTETAFPRASQMLSRELKLRPRRRVGLDPIPTYPQKRMRD